MRAAKPLVAIGLIEDMSITSLPAVSPSATPCGPNSTRSTSGVSGTIRIDDLRRLGDRRRVADHGGGGAQLVGQAFAGRARSGRGRPPSG